MSLGLPHMSSHYRPSQRTVADRLRVWAAPWRCLAALAAAAVSGCAHGPRCGDDWYAQEKKAPLLHTVASAPNAAPANGPIVRGQSPGGYVSPTPAPNNYPNNYSSPYPTTSPNTYSSPAPNAYSSPAANSGAFDQSTPGSSGQTRQPLPVSGAPVDYGASPYSPRTAQLQPAPTQPAPTQPGGVFPGAGQLPPPNVYGAPSAPAYGSGVPQNGPAPEVTPAPYGVPAVPYGGMASPFSGAQPGTPALDPTVPIDVVLQETQTGRFQFGVGVNSDAGVTGQIVIDERNFDWQRVPTSTQDWVNGTAFRGAGQGFRIEAMPGNQVQRYMVSFTEPYLFGFSPISLSLSAFFYNRNFFDWSEERLGGRAALGYRLSHDLSISAAVRAEAVELSNPRVLGVADLDRAVGDTDFFSGRVQLTHDTRDIPFFPSEGHYMELAFEQGFGEFKYPRVEFDYRKYFLVRERPDGSGRHTLAYSFRVGVSGDDTPIFENYFSGGYSTMRGFDFRGASPMDGGVTIGGHMRFLGSVEYFFPITADDMVKGVVFCDFGTTEREIEVDWDNYRVAPGFGIRLNIPALGPAPLALDLAVPIARATTDNIQNFSFFFGFSR